MDIRVQDPHQGDEPGLHPDCDDCHNETATKNSLHTGELETLTQKSHRL